MCIVFSYVDSLTNYKECQYCFLLKVKWFQILSTLEFSPSLTVLVQFSSVTQSFLTLWLHKPQYARPPCPSPIPEFTQTHFHWVGDAINPFHPLLSPSPPALNLSQHQGLWLQNPQNFNIRLVIICFYLARYNRKICCLFESFIDSWFWKVSNYHLKTILHFRFIKILWKINFEVI